MEMTTIHSALDHLQRLRNFVYCYDVERNKLIGILIHKLRGLRTFLLCSILVVTEDSKDLRSLLLRVEQLACTTKENDFSRDGTGDKVSDILADVESLEEEIDKWYISLSDLLQSGSPVPDQVNSIADSVLENLDDFLSFHRAYVGVLVQPIEALKEQVTFLRNFIRFANLLCPQHQKFHGLLTQIQSLAISAAHLTAHLFSASHYNFQVFSMEIFSDIENSRKNLSYDGVKFMISALLLRINPVDNPCVCETYSQSLASLKSFRDVYVLTRNSPLVIMEDFIVFLLSTLWDILLLESRHVYFKDQLQALYEGLRTLRTIIKKQPNKFDVKIMAAVICDAGIIIFSVCSRDSVIALMLPDFLEKVKEIRSDVEDTPVASKPNFPKTNVLGFLDFLLDYLTEVKNSQVDSEGQSYAQKIREELVFLSSFMGKLVELRNQQQDIHEAVWNLSAGLVYKIEFLIDQLVLGSIQDSFLVSFQSILQDIGILKMGSMNILCDIEQEIKVQEVIWTATLVPSHNSSSTAGEVVGFKEERSTIIGRLIRGSKKLQPVAIVGMPGSGKTALAMQIYSDPFVTHHFHARAWCSVSLVFNRREVLLELIKHVQKKVPDQRMNEDDLSQELWRSLKRRRYLIYMDDVWDVQAFDCLIESLPDDSNGSRILLTSRLSDVGKVDESPHLLRQFTARECLDLLQRKLFPGKVWPPLLYEFGMKIAENCKGLPLTVVIVAGLLMNTKQEIWKEVLKSLRSGIISNTDQCRNTIELSYKHLPDHLKPCFLSFGSFPEDHKVPTKRLIWLWIAEGFVRKSQSKSLEEVATDYLENLIGRSLVMNAKERSIGGIKACHIHDLLHDFCFRKAKEENFFRLLKGYEELLYFDEPGNLRRLCIYSEPEHLKESRIFCPRLRSLLFFHPIQWDKKLDISFIFHIFKLLRVLDVEQVYLTFDFPSEVRFLVHLRFLAIQATREVSPSVGTLCNLETFILRPVGQRIVLPDTFWNLQKLRHLYLSGATRFSGIILPVESSCNFLELNSLSSLYCYNWNIMEKQLKRLPNICQLKCSLFEFGDDPVNGGMAMAFSFLSKLESLDVSFHENYTQFEFLFPENIKKLTLYGCGLSWKRISRIAELPNLEVLKLLGESFIGDGWHVEEGEFSNLKFLKLESLDLVSWTASNDQFPYLEKLVLEYCLELEDIPECLENAANLQVIEVLNCPDCIAIMVEKIEVFQKDMGNSLLQVHVRSIS